MFPLPAYSQAIRSLNKPTDCRIMARAQSLAGDDPRNLAKLLNLRPRTVGRLGQVLALASRRTWSARDDCLCPVNSSRCGGSPGGERAALNNKRNWQSSAAADRDEMANGSIGAENQLCNHDRAILLPSCVTRTSSICLPFGSARARGLHLVTLLVGHTRAGQANYLVTSSTTGPLIRGTADEIALFGNPGAFPRK